MVSGDNGACLHGLKIWSRVIMALVLIVENMVSGNNGVCSHGSKLRSQVIMALVYMV